MTTIGDIVSRLRNAVKEQSDDSRFTNRYLWSVYNNNLKQLIKQEGDTGRVYSMSDVWQSICVEMEPVSSLYCNCQFLPYNCTVYRSKKRIPAFMESSDGFVYRWIATPDMSKDFVLVSPYQYHVKRNIKYNRERYAFIHDGYLYTPSHTYSFLSISAIFEGDTSEFDCKTNQTYEELHPEPETTLVNNVCGSKLKQKISIAGYLENAAIKMSLTELFTSVQVKADEIPNSNDTLKDVTP